MSRTAAARRAEPQWGAAADQRHRPEQTLLYRLVEQHYPGFVEHMARQGRALPDYVQREFEEYLKVRPPGARLSAGALRGLPRRTAGGLQLQAARLRRELRGAAHGGECCPAGR